MNHGGRNAVGRGNAGTGDAVVSLEQFKKLGSPVFKGKADPIAVETTMPRNDHITWEMFKNAFNEKYFLDRVRFKMERDFLSLKQGNKSITEYEDQFTSLSRFTTKLIPDDESKGRRFLDRLHLDIQVRHGTQFKKHNNGGSKGSEKTLGDTPFKKNLLPCQRCGGTHAREFYMITRACFGCGKMDHKIKDCPKRHYDLDTA
ncbi:hypothetical protein QYF36_018178 [Acer negundo]|nr:hypothetical protein QYF36_018178 [Acer negundo]